MTHTPRPTEIRDPILRLFIEEILRQTPNGEAIRVTYRPNGEWSVLPEGKADAGLAKGNVWDRIGDHPYVRGFNAGIKHGRAQAAALTTGADGGSRHPAPRADDALLRRALHILETTGISYFVNKGQGRPNWEAARDEVGAVCDGLRAALASEEPTAAKGD